MKDLIQETIAQIKQQKIAPESKWKYVVKKYGVWSLLIFIVVLAAISFSVALDMGRSLDWDLYHFVHQNRFMYTLSILPYFWIILIVAFLVLAILDIRKTEMGYRYSRTKILMIIVGGVAVLSIFISLFNFGGVVHMGLQKEFSIYGHHMMTTKEDQWMQPSKGLLAGTIMTISGDELMIHDLEGASWHIFLNDEMIIKPSVDMVQGEMIKLIGTKIDERVFSVVEIRPWNSRMKNEHSGRGMRDSYMMLEQ